MSLSFWSSVSAGPSPVPSTPPRSAALDLLVALKSANLQVFTSADLRIKSDAVLIAGLGGFSRIEVGSLPSDRSKLVAVKHSSLFPRSYAPALPDAYDKHLVQLTLELRILSHNKLRQHPNILKVLGICVNDINLAQSLSLACELSEVGSLRSLLLKQGSQLSLNQHIDLISQVGKGLEAVHCLGVAHGDVKIENALIFYEQDSSLLVRICDFGQSCVHLADEKFSAAPINPPQGTPLLNAPEIRNGECFHAASFTIKDAILTDIFSFGLLAWEVLKDGKRYFDLNWPDYKESDPELDSMVQYLNELPRNQLCHYGLNFLKSRGLGNIDQSSGFYKAVESCLQDDPDQRQPMSTVVELIDTSKINLEIVQKQLVDLYEFDSKELSSTSLDESLYEVLRAGQSRRWIADEIPEILLEKFAFDLALLAQSETVSQQARAHAAMLLSELYTLRTGSADTKVEKSTKWLHFAAELGCQKAAFWYQRVCHANGVIPLPLESTELNRVSDDSLLSAPTSYLIGRIHRLNAAIHRDIHDSISTNQFTSPTRTLDPCLKMVLFNSTQVDTIAPLHLACYLGDTVAVSNLLESYSPNDKSDHGLNAAHYACLGGSAPALEILIERSVDVSGQAFQNITPLHLAIFMPLETIDTVIYLLLKNGASPDISTEEVQWHAHDIVLSGTPLEWAINTRNLPLVKALAPHSAAHTAQCLGLAVELYFWEIAEELSSWCKKLGNTPWRTDPFPHVLVTERPFRHWIAHGRDHFTAIEKTIQICCRESFLANGAKYDTTHLFASVGLAMFDHDLHVIRTLMSSWPDSYHKHHTIDGDTLAVAIERSRHNDAWADILDMFFERHQTEELQECWYENGMSLLEYAIHRDSTVAVRALFRKGVDINHRPLGALHPPINWWTVSRHSSNEMLHLLLENGAHIPTDFYNALTGQDLDFSSVFDYLLIHDTWNRRGVNVFLAHCLNEENCAKILHRSNILAIFGGSGQISVPGAPRSQAAPRHQWLPYESQGKLRPQNIDAFRSLLSHDIAKKHIDDVDEMGMTMLYRSSFLLHPEIVGLLLDAGADPSLPSTFDGSKFCPLQVCCSSARLIASQWFSSIGVFAREDDDVVDNDIQHPPWEELSHAMETATELVRCHEARGDKRFQGISRLSLAWSMLYLPEVERLTDLVVDVRMLGAQLGKSRPLTGKELTKALAKRRYFPLSIINADKEVNTIESGKQI